MTMPPSFPGIEALAGHFPGSAVVAGDPVRHTGAVFGAELDAIAQAVAPRRRQFMAGRSLAREALLRLRQAPIEIPRLDSGAPAWPAGVVGSIAHCAGCAVAIAAPDARWLGFGIDVEPAEALPEDAASIALTANERLRLARLAPHWGRVVFCAKECVHKLVHPLTGAWLEFDEVAIDLDVEALAYRVLPLSQAAEAALAGLRGSNIGGRIAVDDGFICTVLAAAADRR